MDHILESLAQFPTDWHEAGSLVPEVQKAIVKHCSRENKFEHTMETGSGISTLLFSHLSNDHLAFTLGGAKSLDIIRGSDLLRGDAVTFIEGPTQTIHIGPIVRI